MKIAAIIQARMGSTRLPGKSLADLAGKPMALRVVERVRRSRLANLTALATTTDAADDPLASAAADWGALCVRGHPTDVLDRYRQAAEVLDADVIARVTGDCPMLDPDVLDQVIERFLAGDCDYASNVLRYTYPDGLDVEVFSRAALERAWREAEKPSEREHVTPYLRLHPSFRRASVENAVDLSGRQLRWTVDDPADLTFARAVYRELGDDFGMNDVLALLERRPELLTMNNASSSNEGYYRSLYDQATTAPPAPRRLERSAEWFERAKQVIPGCAQTFSKGHTQHIPGVSPLLLQRGQGCRVWDVDGNEYIDYIQGLLPNILGYAHPEVNAAASAQYAQGHSFSLPHPLEIELAERLTRLIPCAEMVRFGKNGSDATSGAVRAARAYTGRDRVACCGYHGWQDWYIGSTPRNAGVPQAVRDLTHKFAYNDLKSLETTLEAHPGEFAAVILEPFNFTEPQPGFLQGVKDLAHRHGALLIFDEICVGFHFGLGGAQKLFGVTPDLACFGKAMGNGYPIACVVGRTDVMNVFAEIFFSFTFGGEVASLAATMKVLDLLEQTDALARIESQGRRIQDGFNTLAASAGLSHRFRCVGRPNWSLVQYLGADGKDCLLTRSLFQQEAVKRGVLLLATHNMSAAHGDADVEQTLEAYAAVFKTLAGWLSDANPARFLEGPMIQPVFRVR